MALLSPEVTRLIAQAPAHLPLTQAALRPVPGICETELSKAATLFPGARHAQAALAGLLFRLGCWMEGHLIAQDISSSEGSYWHGMLYASSLTPRTHDTGSGNSRSIQFFPIFSNRRKKF